MPFIALDKDTRKRIDITQLENPRLILRSGDCICQACEEPMIVKAGLIVRSHFAHRSTCISDYQYHPESPDHLALKYLVMQALKENIGEYSDAEIELEVKVPEVNRIADIMATWPMGWRVAHEIQLASITIEKLNDRTEDYHRAGIDVIWWLGKSADTPANRKWCEDKLGFSVQLENYPSR